MRRFAETVLAGLVLAGCVAPGGPGDGPDALEQFEVELEALRAQLDVPGLAFAIVENGRLLDSGGLGTVTTDTPLGIASVTKSLTAVLVQQLVFEGKLEMNAPVATYLPEAGLPDDVQLWHLMTHTSEGIPGREYVYGPTRYAMLGSVVEQVTGEPFETVLRNRIIEPARMQWFDSPNLAAHFGMVSNVEQMARFVQALDRGTLLDDEGLGRLTTPATSSDGKTLPIGMGWFAQTVQGRSVSWSYGQDDSGALLYRVPERGLTLFVLADHYKISDAFRLLMADASRSPFAMAFHRIFIASRPERPLQQPDWSATDLAAALGELERLTEYRYDDELIGQTLVRIWVGDVAVAEELLEIGMQRYDLMDRLDPVLHFAALRLPDGPVKQAAVEMGGRLLHEHPQNRWILLTQARLLNEIGETQQASAFFEQILGLPNQQDDFLHRLFDRWCWLALAEIYSAEQPERARRFLTLLLDSGIEGDERREVESMLQSLRPD